MKVLMLLDGPYEGDFRLKKEVDTLIGSGHQVTVICYRTGEKPLESVDGKLRLLRTNKIVDHKRAGIIDILNSIFFINYEIKNRLSRLNEKFDVVHVHDLPLANTGLQFARKHGYPCILDLHENYPEALKIWFTWRKNPLVRLKNQLFFNYSRWFERERKMVNEFDQIIAVVEEMKERLVEIHQADESKIAVVSNTEPKDLFLPIETAKQTSQKFQIVYVGGIGPHRGLQIAIEAMMEIVSKHPTAELVIIGSGNSDTISYLKDLVNNSGVEAHVRFTGRLPFEKALEYMRGAGMNIIPHLKNNHTDNTIPHKLFQIMNSEFPLLVSSCNPLRRIVEEHDAGLVFEAGSPSSFAAQIDYAVHHPEELKAKAKNAHDAVQKKGLNWERDAAKLLEVYDELLTKS